MNWINKTCKECIFRSGEECVYLPPTVLATQHDIQTRYPIVFIPKHTHRAYKYEEVREDYYSKACSQYKEK